MQACCHTVNCFLCSMHTTWKKCVQTPIMVRMQYFCTASLFHGYFFSLPDRPIQRHSLKMPAVLVCNAQLLTITFLRSIEPQAKMESVKEIESLQISASQDSQQLGESRMFRSKLSKAWHQHTVLQAVLKRLPHFHRFLLFPFKNVRLTILVQIKNHFGC